MISNDNGANWEKIYQDYRNGEIFSPLKGDLLSDFTGFVETTTFSAKKALDIGCGDGKYLRYLANLGFTVSGIDYSPTAVSITKEVLSAKADVAVKDMYKYDIPKNKFDLIFSIAAIHHGKKEEVHDLINRILSASMPNGKVFITLPAYPEDGLIASLYRTLDDLMTRHIFRIFSKNKTFRGLHETAIRKAWENGKEWEYLGNGVILPISGPEEGVIHSFYRRREVNKMFSRCRAYSIKKVGGNWIIKITGCPLR
jgi:SAM-dependent methyltransferase